MGVKVIDKTKLDEKTTKMLQMKLTKKELREIIEEEYYSMLFEDENLQSTTPFRSEQKMGQI